MQSYCVRAFTLFPEIPWRVTYVSYQQGTPPFQIAQTLRWLNNWRLKFFTTDHLPSPKPQKLPIALTGTAIFASVSVWGTPQYQPNVDTFASMMRSYPEHLKLPLFQIILILSAFYTRNSTCPIPWPTIGSSTPFLQVLSVSRVSHLLKNSPSPRNPCKHLS